MPTADQMPATLQAELRQQRPFRSTAQETTIAVLRTADVIRRQFTGVVESAGITLAQYNVLRILRGALPEPLATYEIADRLIEQTPGVTRLLDRLEARQLVTRQRSSEDRRLVHCRVTDDGLALLATLDAAVDAADDAAVGMLTPDELAILTRLLARVRAGTAAAGRSSAPGAHTGSAGTPAHA